MGLWLLFRLRRWGRKGGEDGKGVSGGRYGGIMEWGAVLAYDEYTKDA